MIQLTKITKASDVVLDGIDVLNMKMDGETIRGILLRDKKGNYLDISESPYSGFNVSVKKKPEIVKKFKLVGSAFDGTVKINELFDKEPEAITRKDEMTNKCLEKDMDSVLSISTIEVEDVAKIDNNQVDLPF